MSRDLTKYDDRCYMAELEVELGRDRSTIRTWEKQGWLPEGLEFHRDEGNLRYWTPAQVEQAKEWMASRHPGRTATRRAS